MYRKLEKFTLRRLLKSFCEASCDRARILWKDGCAALPYAMMFGTSFLAIHFVRHADLVPFIGKWEHETRKQAIFIKKFLTKSLEKEHALCFLLCELAMWYTIVSPTCRLDSFVLDLVDTNEQTSVELHPHIREGVLKLQAIVREVEASIAEELVCSRSDVVHLIVCAALEAIGGPRLKCQIGRKDPPIDQNDMHMKLLHSLTSNLHECGNAKSLHAWFPQDVRALRARYHSLCNREMEETVSETLAVRKLRRLTRKMWTDQYVVALYGGFRALRQESGGTASPRSFEPFSNRYFSSVLHQVSEVQRSAKVTSKWEQYFTFARNSRFGDLDKSLTADPLSVDAIRLYALDEDYFFESFACIFTWLLDRGFNSNELIDVYYKH